MDNCQNYDLLNEVDCAYDCEAILAFCAVVDHLLADIRHLELECISTRYMLSHYLEEERGEMLRLDILENLGDHKYRNDSAYEAYKNIMYGGGDPMEFRDYLVKVREASEGKLTCWH